MPRWLERLRLCEFGASDQARVRGARWQSVAHCHRLQGTPGILTLTLSCAQGHVSAGDAYVDDGLGSLQVIRSRLPPQNGVRRRVDVSFFQ